MLPVVEPEVVPVVVLPEVVPEVLPAVVPEVVPVVLLPEVVPEVVSVPVPVVAQAPKKLSEAQKAAPSSQEIFVRFIGVEMKSYW